MIVYRISDFADLSGVGGERASARWHTKMSGRRIVYTADHPALCILEVLVHFNELPEVPDNYQLLRIDVPDDLIRRVEDLWDLPEDWSRVNGISQQIGNQWLATRTSGGMLVPSIIVPLASNCLLNPLVPAIAKIVPEVVGRFPFDSRLFDANKYE